MKPIIFSAPMVQAILDGRKTQVRLVIKPQPIPIIPITIDGEVCLSWSHEQPYKSGDILWVKETWQEGSLLSSTEETFKKYVYKADDIKNKRWWIKWCSPVSMPKEAARLFLLVKSIQPERLQDISGFDCVREGVNTLDILENTPEKDYEEYARLQFSKIWDKQNANKGYSWRSNPWVWKIEFERTEKS